MWLFHSSVIGHGFFSPLNTFPTRVHKNLKVYICQSVQKRVYTNFQCSQVSSESR